MLGSLRLLSITSPKRSPPTVRSDILGEVTLGGGGAAISSVMALAGMEPIGVPTGLGLTKPPCAIIEAVMASRSRSIELLIIRHLNPCYRPGPFRPGRHRHQ